MGFLDNRAAQVSRIVWHDFERARPEDRAESVSVAVSMDSVYGPWTPLGDYTIDREGALTVPITFDGPVWARYLRFTVSGGPEQGKLMPPNQIEIRERAAAPDYRSILGAWGHGSKAAWREFSIPEQTPVYGTDDNDTPGTADPLVWDVPVEDRVTLDEDVDWHSFDVPEGGGTFRLDLSARPAIEVVAELFDQDNKPVEMAYDQSRRLDREYRARLQQGRYFLKISEIPRSIIVAWDTSGSVARYVPMTFRAVREFTKDVVLGREEVNFVPFHDQPEPLLDLDEWAVDAVGAGAALHTYDQRHHNSSNAEITMIRALRELDQRDGVRAVIMITDAVTDGYKLRPAMWDMFERIRPRVFTLTVPSGGTGPKVREPATVMRDWAVENGGFNQSVSDQGAVEQAFRRAAVWLRRPAPYKITAKLDLVPPEPGFLLVKQTEDEPLLRNMAVEVILDASGSMLKRMQGKRRFQIAKSVLNDLVKNSLPTGIPFALRVFGQGEPGSCVTNLQSALAPLDPAEVRKAIKPIRPTNLAKTPIGDALSYVTEDLKDIDGPRLIILLTDGEETCDGDASAEIAKLRAAGFDVQVNIVGFAIDDEELAATFARWAAEGGGGYFAAGDANSLAEAMKAAVTPRFQVLKGDEVVAFGQVNSPEKIELPAGPYMVRIAGRPDATVIVPEGALVEITIDSD
ncbi:MAG: VWA domain-containing protein [Pseudomonadota bacterium]